MERLDRVGTHVGAAPAAPSRAHARVEVDLLIAGGRVIDPANGVDGVADVAVAAGRVVAVGRDLRHSFCAAQTHDAGGQIVTPGLVDAHGHFYRHCTPLGEPADEVCLGRGVTTAVDAGSAGATTFEGFRKFAAEPARTRLLCILNASMHGLASAGSTGGGAGGELDSLNQVRSPAGLHAWACLTHPLRAVLYVVQVQVEPLVRCIEANRDLVVGVKVRLSADAANDGKNELEAYRRALRACELASVPLMTHHTFSTVPLTQCPGEDASPIRMRAGDLYTHSFHGFETTIIEEGRVAAAAWEAKRRGVLFDVGHGQGSFNWTVAKIATDEGFWPDIISTDIHRDSRHGPCYDLPTVSRGKRRQQRATATTCHIDVWGRASLLLHERR
jgi:dihydroorotase